MYIKGIPFFLLIATSVLFAGCTKENSMSGDVPEGKLISLTIPANYYSYYNFSDFFVNSLDGKLITSKEINSAEEVVFEADQNENTISNRYDFTRCLVKDMGTYKSINFYTNIGILPFSLLLKNSTSTFEGTAYVKFTNVPAYSSFLLANAYSNLTSGNLATTTFSIPLFSNLAKGLFIKLNTPAGGLYKFIDNLVAGQTITVSLSGMSSDFSTADIILNNNTYDYSDLSVDRYAENDFSSASYSVFSSSVTGSPFTYSYPVSFLSGHYLRFDFSGTSSNRYAWTNVYSDNLVNSIDLLEGDVTFTDKFPESFSYSIDMNDKVDVLYFARFHSTTFRDANGFRVSWYIYVSPSVRDVILPEIPDEILSYLSGTYGINDLQLQNLETGYVYLYQNGRASNFDEWMKRYWLGWENPGLDEVDKGLNITFPANKNDTESGKSPVLPEVYNSVSHF